MVYTGGDDGVLRKMHLADPKQNAAVASGATPGAVRTVAVSRSGQTVFTAASDGIVRRWTANLTPHPRGAEVKWSGNGFAGSRSTIVSALAAFNDELPAVGFASGGGLLPGASRGFKTNETCYWIAIPPHGPAAMNATPGRVILDGRIDLPTGDAGSILAGVYSPDGTTLLTGSQDGVIRGSGGSRDVRERGATLRRTSDGHRCFERWLRLCPGPRWNLHPLQRGDEAEPGEPVASLRCRPGAR